MPTVWPNRRRHIHPLRSTGASHWVSWSVSRDGDSCLRGGLHRRSPEKYRSPSLVHGGTFPDPHGGLNPRVVPTPVYAILFPVGASIPLRLQEALHSSSVAFLKCQHHHSCAWGHYSVKQRSLEHKHGDIVTVDVIPKTAWRHCRDGSGPARTEQEGPRFHHATRRSAQFKTYGLFISGIFHLVFLDHGWLRVNDSLESKTTDQGGLSVLGRQWLWSSVC